MSRPDAQRDSRTSRRPLRVTSDRTKATILVVGIVLALAAIPMLAVLGGIVVGYAAVLAFTVALVLVPARCFRGPGEAVDPPRPWWRATNRPTAGYVIGALYVLQGFALLVRHDADGLGAVGVLFGVVDLVLGAYLVRSSVRLSREGLPGPRPTVR